MLEMTGDELPLMEKIRDEYQPAKDEPFAHEDIQEMFGGITESEAYQNRPEVVAEQVGILLDWNL